MRSVVVSNDEKADVRRRRQQLDPDVGGFLKKTRLLLRLLQLLERGRLCLAGRCVEPATVAARVRRRTRVIETPLCLEHARQLTGSPGQPLTLRTGWRLEGTRRIAPREVLDGPIPPDETEGSA
jgi:hypothetical protein